MFLQNNLRIQSVNNKKPAPKKRGLFVCVIHHFLRQKLALSAQCVKNLSSEYKVSGAVEIESMPEQAPHTGIILYFKKKRQAFVARIEEGRVFLPLSARQTLDGISMCKMRNPKPKERDKVIVRNMEPVGPDFLATAWALASA